MEPGGRRGRGPGRAAEAGRIVRRTLRMMRAHSRALVAAVAVLVVFTLATVAGPFIVEIRDRPRARVRITSTAGSMDWAAGVYIVVAILMAVIERAQIVMVNRVGESFLRELRKRVFAHISRCRWPSSTSEPTGRLVSRMTQDIDALEKLVQQGIVIFVTSGLLFVGVLVIMAVLSPLLFLATMVVLPPVVHRRAESSVATRTSPTCGARPDRPDALDPAGVDGRASGSCRRSAGRRSSSRRFVDHNQAQYDANVDAVRLSARYFPIVEFTNAAATAIDHRVRRPARALAPDHDWDGQRLRLVPRLSDRPNPAVQPALQPRPAVRGGDEEALRAARHPSRRFRSGPARSNCRRRVTWSSTT